ncbi:flavin-containing monooxygenase-like protein [Leptotrombidium deliense]|uniref:Flavin-containing monooxygenase n=1 Tax=Leptotrombidium deliense TaxID=299467 RepID=A0A443S6D8_9ACAR|nr:flavin-containing monooxygenase-like protein [Leptotrombidium deliense]
MSTTKKLICIIGAGASGLTSIKQCIEEGFDVICYERSDNIGGLWRYRDEVIPGVASVAKTTLANTSKDIQAFSDFPPPKNGPNFMDNTKQCEYFEAYADYFHLKQYVKFNHEVVSVVYNDDYNETGKWKVKVLEKTNNNTAVIVFDGVLVCIGHHVKPTIPKFLGLEKFKGKIVHSCEYKTWKGYEDKNVVVVGIGSSGADIATEVSLVYISSRSGAWVGGRVGTNGIPFDVLIDCRIIQLILSLIPTNMLNTMLEYLFNSYFDHNLYGLKPKHRLLSQHLTINDSLAKCIITGAILVRPNIQEFTENGVIFEGMKEETKCDVLVLATGYELSFSFLDSSIVSVVQNRVEAYKNVFLPHLKHPHTLGLIGLIQTTGPLFPLSEMQARWFAKLMNGKAKLPSKEEMLQAIDNERKIREEFCDSPRHTLEVNFIKYMDEIASFIGVKPKLWKYFFTDRQLWYALIFGPSLPYQYRLEGPNKWSDARRNILEFDSRLKVPLRDNN